MKILNLTQHPATPEQIEAGVVDCQPHNIQRLKELLTFETLPSHLDVRVRALNLKRLAQEEAESRLGDDITVMDDMAVMIGGASFLMAPLEDFLKLNFKVFYAFSERVSVETVKDDGSVVKTNVFKHAGFVEAQ